MTAIQKITVTDEQSTAIRWITEHRTDNDGYLGRQAVIDECVLSEDEYDRLLVILVRSGSVEIHPVDDGIYANNFRVLAPIVDLVHQLDNQPLEDYPKKIKTWFFSKWWSIPFWGLVVGLPAILGYVTMLQMLLEWLGIID